ncbi:MAG: DUF3800 domain-containing protein [Sphingopyxis sp.]|nr:DUF3800 domain-containing protein [Sphingopyxis sp.]
MAIFCDESGGAGAGITLMAGVSLPAATADSALARIRHVLGLRGELKGSRISLAERAFVIELVMRMGARAIVVSARHSDINPAHIEPADRMSDLAIYAMLLEQLVDAWLPLTGGCAEFIIDDGRYDPRITGHLRDDVQTHLGQWGKASLVDSHRSAGVQIADVIANSHFQIATGARFAHRVEALLAPFHANGAIKHIVVDQPS